MNLPCLRRASALDTHAIQDLQLSSLKGLAAVHYTPQQLEAFAAYANEEVAGLLSASSTWVVDEDGLLVACASWLIQRPGLARLRSVYVRAGWERRGLASRVVDRVEHEAVATGASHADLLAMRGSEAFYAHRGYKPGKAGAVDVHGMPFPGLWMSKPLSISPAADCAA